MFKKLLLAYSDWFKEQINTDLKTTFIVCQKFILYKKNLHFFLIRKMSSWFQGQCSPRVSWSFPFEQFKQHRRIQILFNSQLSIGLSWFKGKSWYWNPPEKKLNKTFLNLKLYFTLTNLNKPRLFSHFLSKQIRFSSELIYCILKVKLLRPFTTRINSL